MMSWIETAGKFLLIAGGTIAGVGGLLWLLGKIAILGRLPGDIRIERPAFSCLIPLVSSIIISIVLTVLLNIIIRIIKR